MQLCTMMEHVGCPAWLGAILGPMLAKKGLSLESDIDLRLDRDNERFTLTCDGATILDATFDQVEAVFREQGGSAEVDGTPVPGLPAVPGQPDPDQAGVPGA